MNLIKYTFYMQKLIEGKKYLLLLAAVIILLVWGAGCSDNSVTGPVNNSVTFEMMNRPGTNGGTEFLFKPSVDVKIYEIVSSLPPLYDTVVDNSNHTFSKNSFHIIKEFNGIASGQQWDFQFFGTDISTNVGFIITTSYSVP